MRRKLFPAFGVGLDLARGLTKNCTAGASCSATDYRFRFEAIFTSRAGFAVDPWLGFGVGYEWLVLSGDGLDYQDPPGSIGFSGWTYAIIEAGGELRQCASPFRAAAVRPGGRS